MAPCSSYSTAHAATSRKQETFRPRPRAGGALSGENQRRPQSLPASSATPFIRGSALPKDMGASTPQKASPRPASSVTAESTPKGTMAHPTKSRAAFSGTRTEVNTRLRTSPRMTVPDPKVHDKSDKSGSRQRGPLFAPNCIDHLSPRRRSHQESVMPRSPREMWPVWGGGISSPRSSDSFGACAPPRTARKVREVLNRSTFLEERGVYEQAAKPRCLELSRLQIRGLPNEACERSLARVCQAFGQHVVRVETGFNPVRHCGNGEATLLLRSSSKTSSMPALVRFLEERAGCEVGR